MVFYRFKSVNVKTFKSLLADVLSRVQCLPGAQSSDWLLAQTISLIEKQVFPAASSVKIIAHQVRSKLSYREIDLVVRVLDGMFSEGSPCPTGTQL